jgi:hypothetical protein
MDTFCNGFTESYYILLQGYPFSRSSCRSVYKPYAYSAITLIHYIYIHTPVSWLRGKMRFHFGGNELRVSKSICSREYWTQSDTHIKSYHFVFNTHANLGYSLKHNFHENVCVCARACVRVVCRCFLIKKSSFHDRKITYLCLCSLVFRHWIFRQQIHGCQPYNRTETKRFD